MAFWKAQHLPGLRLTANGTQNDKAEAGSIPVLTTKIKIMAKIILEFTEDEENDARVAIDGYKYKHFIWELDQKLRSVHKYGAALQGQGEATSEEMDVCYRLRDVIREMLQEDNLTIE